MKKFRTAAALILALALALSLAGCGTAMSDASAMLVQGNLDEIYLGKFDPDFLTLVDSTEEEAQTIYEDGIEVEVNYFMQFFGIEYPTDEITQELTELYKEIYSHSMYEVGEAADVSENTYGVPLTIYPIDIMQKVADQMEAAAAELQAQYTDEEIALITTDENAYIEYDHAWAEMLMGLVRDNMDGIGYLEPVDMVVQVTRGDDDVWTIDDGDFQRIDAQMIYYPAV